MIDLSRVIPQTSRRIQKVVLPTIHEQAAFLDLKSWKELSCEFESCFDSARLPSS